MGKSPLKEMSPPSLWAVPTLIVSINWLGLWQIAELSLAEATRVSLQLAVGLAIVTGMMSLTQTAGNSLPTGDVFFENHYFVQWTAIAATCVALAWLSFGAMLITHLRADFKSDSSAMVRSRTLTLCAIFPLQATLYLSSMWQADEDTENTSTMISLLDIIMLFLLVRMLMGYAGGFKHAYKAFSSLEPQAFLAQAPLMCCWSKCQPPVTFNKGLMRWIKINLLTMLGLAFISSVIHIFVVRNQDSSQECSNTCLGTMYTTKIMLIGAVQQVLTVLRPLEHAL